jgi:hypothetical protein
MRKWATSSETCRETDMRESDDGEANAAGASYHGEAVSQMNAERESAEEVELQARTQHAVQQMIVLHGDKHRQRRQKAERTRNRVTLARHLEDDEATLETPV